MELIFDPLELADVEVRLDGHHAGMAVPLRINRHVHPRAQPLSVSPARRPGSTTSALIRKRRERELQKRIDYRNLPRPDDHDHDRKEDAG